MFGPGVLATAFVLVAPLIARLAVIFVAVFPEEGHGGLEVLVGLQTDDLIKGGADPKPSDYGGNENQQQ